MLIYGPSSQDQIWFILMTIKMIETAHYTICYYHRCLTQLSDVVLGDVAREGDWTSEQWCVGSSVIQPEALMLAHLGGRFPRCLYNTAVHHLGVEGGRRGHCNTIQTVNHSGTTT